MHEKGTFNAQDAINNIKKDPNYPKAGAIALFIGVVRGETFENEKVEKLTVFNTICQATKDRQQAVRKLAPRVDAIIVVGSKISSNTKKLFHIAKGKNKNSLQIETCADLQKPRILAKIAKFTSIGITAGASTSPEELNCVKNFLRKL